MNETGGLIFIIDDEQHIRNLVGDVISQAGYMTRLFASAPEALAALAEVKPDLVLLDILMPVMDGYEFCEKMQAEKDLSLIPVVFLTALSAPKDKAKAFSLGAADYLTKPFENHRLLETVRKHLKTGEKWRDLGKEEKPAPQKKQALSFVKFQEFLENKLKLPAEKKEKLSQMKTMEAKPLCDLLGVSGTELAQHLAEFSGFEYCAYINPEDIQLGKLPAPFCRKNLVVSLKNSSGGDVFVLANPFNFELFDTLRAQFKDAPYELAIADRQSIEFLLGSENATFSSAVGESNLESVSMDKFPVVRIADNIVHSAIKERASDIHIEPKEQHIAVRFRIDGEMKDAFALKKETGGELISRFKVLGGLNIAERRKPQDGAMEFNYGEKCYKLRLATTSTPSGESMVIRLLDPNVRPKLLSELGTTEEQMKTLVDFASRDRGFILIVGPTGSGKTTTIYSLLAQVDCKKRSLASVEDPVEYKIPFANQQQVNEKAGITFESVLKSAMRQDPDVLFLGEVRDAFSAKASMDFASTGHLTITTLHTSNATTAVFRLERLGVTRSVMADTVLGVVAQRLLKKLCEHCKKTAPPTSKEIEMLKPFTDKIPELVASPVGCPKCDQTGFRGREGIYEIIQFDPEIALKIRTNRPISEIRSFVRKRGDYLISHHAIDKVRELKFSVKDIYEKVLVEEPLSEAEEPAAAAQETKAPEPLTFSKAAAEALPVASGEGNSILLAEDNKDNMALISLLLKNAGYKVTAAEDGVEALMHLGSKKFDLILSDVDMPNLDGFKLLEMASQKGITAPILFVTARTDETDEIRGLELGAVDYIKKPIKKEILLMRVKKALDNLMKKDRVKAA